MSEARKEPLQSSLRVQELIYGLRIGEVMTSKVFAVSRNCSMHDVRAIMKENAISGVPVVDSKRVVGIVTMNDLFNALEQGDMDSCVTQWMVGGVQTLAEDMPLSFAISAFGKFSFRQFPVVNRKNELVGIVTFRNINLALIRELSRQLREMEHKHDHPPEPWKKSGTPAKGSGFDRHFRATDRYRESLRAESSRKSRIPDAQPARADQEHEFTSQPHCPASATDQRGQPEDHERPESVRAQGRNIGSQQGESGADRGGDPRG